MAHVIIADVDNTICESCQPIDSDMANILEQLEDYQLAFISGSTVDHLYKQISQHIPTVPHHLLGCSGLEYEVVLPNDVPLRTEVYRIKMQNRPEIISALEEMSEEFNLKPVTNRMDQIQDRRCQITFSALGRNAPKTMKDRFDPDGSKRLELIEWLNKRLFNKYSIRLGGTTSIDITHKNWTKKNGLYTFYQRNEWTDPEQSIFIGDQLSDENGNDYPVREIPGLFKTSVGNPEHTREYLRNLLRF